MTNLETKLLEISTREAVCPCSRTVYGFLSYDPYGHASAFFAKPLMKVLYEGRTHLRERGREKPYGPTAKAYGLAC